MLRWNRSFWSWKGEKYRLVVHGFNHFSGHKLWLGNTYESVCTLECVGKRAVKLVLVCDLCHFSVSLVKIIIALADYSLTVYHDKIADTERKQKLSYSTAGRTCTVYNKCNILYLLVCYLAGVHKCRTDNDSSSVLVVMENRNIHFFFKLCFYLKAPWSSNIFKIYTTEAV